MLPTSLAEWARTRVSFNRIEAYLYLPEHSPCTPGDAASSSKSAMLVRLGEGNPFQWPGTTFSLRRVKVEVWSGQVVGVTGRIGAGKSSLLYAIMGEMPRGDAGAEGDGVDADVFSSSVCYISQKPFISSSTIRDNICFGAPFEHER
jgi:ABC-type transport system involved in cytochrome bd biosynthesis fused ATPase/permease subunit